jgi:hypothetical protein
MRTRRTVSALRERQALPCRAGIARRAGRQRHHPDTCRPAHGGRCPPYRVRRAFHVGRALPAGPGDNTAIPIRVAPHTADGVRPTA